MNGCSLPALVVVEALLVQRPIEGPRHPAVKDLDAVLHPDREPARVRLPGHLQVPVGLRPPGDREPGVVSERVVLVGLDAVTTDRAGEAQAGPDDRREVLPGGASDVQPSLPRPPRGAADDPLGEELRVGAVALPGAGVEIADRDLAAGVKAPDHSRVDAPGPPSRAEPADPHLPSRGDRVLEVDVIHLHPPEPSDPAHYLPLPAGAGGAVARPLGRPPPAPIRRRRRDRRGPRRRSPPRTPTQPPARPPRLRCGADPVHPIACLDSSPAPYGAAPVARPESEAGRARAGGRKEGQTCFTPGSAADRFAR